MDRSNQDGLRLGSVIVPADQWPVALFLDPDSDEITWFPSEDVADAAVALADVGGLAAARALGRSGEPMFERPAGENLEDTEYFWSDEEADAATTDEDIQTALDLAGAWSDLGLDWDEVEAELYRIGHSTPPTPPIEFDLDDDPDADPT
jgi:hypothetical protein